MRNKHRTSEGPIRAPVGVTGRESNGRQTDRLTPSMAGAVTKLGDEGSHLGRHVDKVAAEVTGKEPKYHGEVQRRENRAGSLRRVSALRPWFQALRRSAF